MSLRSTFMFGFIGIRLPHSYLIGHVVITYKFFMIANGVLNFETKLDQIQIL